MSRTVELSITSDYTDWRTWEGIREVIQNAKDAETEGGEMSIKYSPDKARLDVSTQGASLSRNAMLIGFTTKKDDRRMRGEFGEGLALGVLALVNDGKKVTIRTGSEKWVPFVDTSDAFAGMKVLKFRVTGGMKHKDEVLVRIENLSEPEWYKYRKRFTFLEWAPKIIYQTPYHGAILDAPGEVYAKGIYVTTESSLMHGYDFYNARTDRDRRVPNSFDMKYHLVKIWDMALSEAGPDEDLTKRALQIVRSGDDGCYERQAFAYEVSWGQQIARRLTEAFRAKHGEEVIPVSEHGTAKEAAFAGVDAVQVSPLEDKMISSVEGTPEERIQKELRKPSLIYQHDQLETEEIQNLQWAIRLLGLVQNVNPRLIRIVKFSDESLRGKATWDDQQNFIEIARWVLKDKETLLETLIHEYAHVISRADDGEQDMLKTTSRLAVELICRLAKRFDPEDI